jgi:hypothetical protein
MQFCNFRLQKRLQIRWRERLCPGASAGALHPHKKRKRRLTHEKSGFILQAPGFPL